MTRLLLIPEDDDEMEVTTMAIDDPRPARELLIAINTGEMLLGAELLDQQEGRQWAVLHPEIDLITVVESPPPYRLTRRQYQVLFGLSEGKRAAQIADELGISRRTVYLHITEIKERLNAQNISQAVFLADEANLLEG